MKEVALLVFSLTLLAFLSTATAAAQNRSTYDEPFRPQIHYSPVENWMNDPNGLVYHDGEYHLFYQYNPFGNQWGHMSWGHAVSQDLVHWDHLPVALQEEDGVMIFSGSAVIDHGNTSGFGTDDDPAMVAVYTGHRDGHQAQHLAYSRDRGRTWTKYEGNPVLDLGMADFRDPKVFRYEPDDTWVMVVALPTEHKVHFYRSEDLKNWTFLSEFGPAGMTDGIWECPDLFALPVDGDRGDMRWVLEVVLGDDGTPRGSGAQYFVGQFDGTTFTAERPDSVRWVDHGADYYAAVSWNHVPGDRRLWLGWMSNWRYAEAIPTHPWKSSMSLPRSVGLTRAGGHVELTQQPIDELSSLRGGHRGAEDLEAANEVVSVEGVTGTVLELIAVIDLGSADEAGLNVRVGGDEETAIGVDRRESILFVDRRLSGRTDFHEHFPVRHEGPTRIDDGLVRLHVFVDRSSVEVFADDGATVITDRIFPALESDGVQFFARGGTARLVRLDAWPLASIWTNP